MHQRFSTVLMAAALSGFPFAVAAETGSTEARLLAEPMWLLQDAEGGVKQVWFERREGGLQLVRCTNAPVCGRPATISPDGVRVQGFTSTMAVWPETRAGSPSLVPAWVVPISSHGPGH